MGFDLTKINEGITDVGKIVQQGVGIFDSIAQRVTGTVTPQTTTTTATPAVTTPTPAAATSSSSVPWVPILIGGGLLLFLASRRRP